MLKVASSARTDTAGIAIATALAALGAAAICFPATVLRIAPPCLVSLLLDDVCWGCGMTRAALALARGDIAAAWGFNRMAVVVMPMLAWLYGQHLWAMWMTRRVARRSRK